MLTYNDCLGMSELSQEQVAALARIKRLPEVVALEMGWSLCRTPEGKQTIRRMILDDAEAACRRGDAGTAARLGLVLHRFLAGAEGAETPSAFCPNAPLFDALGRRRGDGGPCSH